MRDAPDAAASSDLAAARKAGWRRADLAWEQLQETGNAALQAGDSARAARQFRRARWIALLRFNGRDPRRATTLANLALADRLAGREARAQRRYARARRLWAGVDTFIAGMRIAQRARSSLFHLRMQARHRETYAQNMRVRMTAITRDTTAALAALERGEPVPCRLYSRWRGEKPPVFDDTRKLLAAALLVAVPPPDGAADAKSLVRNPAWRSARPPESPAGGRPGCRGRPGAT